ncbi:hypothetical protein MMC10_003504 [Thelotrema lepadinum]|nr:hypothetical protein [Thelotrema lepadinum]
MFFPQNNYYAQLRQIDFVKASLSSGLKTIDYLSSGPVRNIYIPVRYIYVTEEENALSTARLMLKRASEVE